MQIMNTLDQVQLYHTLVVAQGLVLILKANINNPSTKHIYNAIAFFEDVT